MKKIIVLLLTVVMLISASACASGVSQEEYDRIVQMNTDLISEGIELNLKIAEYELEDAMQNAILESIQEKYECDVSGESFLQYIMKIGNDRESIRAAYEDITSYFLIIKALLSEETTKENLSSYESFYIKAVDENDLTVFEMSYSPESAGVLDISVGSSYISEVTEALTGM